MNDNTQTSPKPEAKQKPRSNQRRRRPQNRASVPRQKPLVDKNKLFLLEDFNPHNQVHLATVDTVGEKSVTVVFAFEDNDLTIKAEVPNEEFRNALPKEGDQLSLYLGDPVQEKEGSTEVAQASFDKAEALMEFDQLKKAEKERQTQISGMVVGPIKGGFSVALFSKTRDGYENGEGLRAFLPYRYATAGRDGHKAEFGNEILAFVLKESDIRKGGLIVSRKEILRKDEKVQESAMLDAMKVGDVVSAKVRSVVDYGAFLDVGALSGLLHISDVSWEKHADTSKLLKEGETLEVKIIELDKEKKRLKFGLKQMQENPWKSAESKYGDGQIIEGQVVGFSSFGVFVHLEGGIEGLIHNSEISWKRVKHASDHFQIGDTVKARVLRFDKRAKKLSLSSKALEKSPVEKVAEQFAVGAVLKTKIVALQDFGVFVALAEDVTGLVHIGEFSWTKRVRHPDEMFKLGEEVEIVVMGFDTVRQRVSCSVKRVNVNPWPKWREMFRVGTLVEAEVKRLTKDGAEVILDGELLAFCPMRELSAEDLEKPSDAAKIGEKLEAEVIEFDAQRGRVKISAKRRQNRESKAAYQSYLGRQDKQGSGTTLGDLINKK